MKRVASRFALMFGWVGLGIVIAVLYGIVNDQMTITLSPEYFTVFKREQFALALEQAGLQNAPPRLQAVLVGILATWWFGLLLGMILSNGGLFGRDAPLPTQRYLSWVGRIMLFTLFASVLSGIIGYLVEPLVNPHAEQWPFLTGIHEVRRAFAVGFWHDGAYLGGFVGTFVAATGMRRHKPVLEG